MSEHVVNHNFLYINIGWKYQNIIQFDFKHTFTAGLEAVAKKVCLQYIFVKFRI